MIAQQKSGQIVYTNKARCRDCYRCIRVCPVKAISMEKEQAFVVEERCIACGTCIRECPQGAKSFRNDIERARAVLRAGKKVAASLAPSYAAVWSGWQRKRLISALRKLGFSYVAETAIGAYPTAQEIARVSKENPDVTFIGTACPAVVNYIEVYKHEFAENLAPVVSPMIAHSRHIRDILGDDVLVVFISPCVAKKSEIDRENYAGEVNGAITFEELQEWLTEEQIELDELEESEFDEYPDGQARLYPLVGGMAETASLPANHLSNRVLTISGYDDLKAALKTIGKENAPLIIEPLFCEHGCINGPAVGSDDNVFIKRDRVLNYSELEKGKPADVRDINLEAEYEPRPLESKVSYTEADIRRVLSETGQVTPEDELNCTACGYRSCRDRAIGVLHGLAQPEMCIPYMRRMAEQRSDRIIETSPNGIVILNDRLEILKMNPAFRTMFMCSEAINGKRISYLMEPEPFERLLADDKPAIEMSLEHAKYGLVCHQIIYKLEEENQIVGIFVNVTSSRENVKKLEKIRHQTIMQAQELMEHQISMAQKVAEFMGESTARGEALVDQLMQLARDEKKEK